MISSGQEPGICAADLYRPCRIFEDFGVDQNLKNMTFSTDLSTPSDRGIVTGGGLAGVGGGPTGESVVPSGPRLCGLGGWWWSLLARRLCEKPPGPPPPRGESGWAISPHHPTQSEPIVWGRADCPATDLDGGDRRLPVI